MAARSIIVSFLVIWAASASAGSYRVVIDAADPDAVAEHFERKGWDVAGHSSRHGTVDVITESPALVAGAQRADAGTASLDYRIRSMEPSRPLAEARDLQGYFDVERSNQELRRLESAHPTWAKVYDLNEWLGTPKSLEGRPILALQVSQNPDRLEDEPKVILIGQHHAREVTTHHTVIDAAGDLLDRVKAGETKARRWVEGSAVWFVPVVNPDGLAYVFSNNNMWRKNRSRNQGGSRGVDLNRNYAFKWGACGQHSSQGSSDIFKGPSAFSEPETTLMDKLNAKLHAQYLLSFHSYGDEVLAPYLCGEMAEKEIYHGVRDRLADTLGYGKRPASSSGEDFEHHYARYGTIAFLLEMGSQFQPSFSSYRSELWPVVKRALPFVMDELDAGFLHIRVRDGATDRGLRANLGVREIRFREGETRSADEFGSFRWRLPAGEYQVTASLEGYGEQSVTVRVTGEGVQEVEIKLTRDDLLGDLRLGDLLWSALRATTGIGGF